MTDFFHIIYYNAQTMLLFDSLEAFRHMTIIKLDFFKEMETKLNGDDNDKNRGKQITGSGCL